MLERWGESVPHKDYVPAAHPDVCYSSRNGPYRTSLRFSELFIFFFLNGTLLELAKSQWREIVPRVFVGKQERLAVLVFSAHEAKRALAKCVSR